jgi:hypothetical protein
VESIRIYCQSSFKGKLITGHPPALHQRIARVFSVLNQNVHAWRGCMNPSLIRRGLPSQGRPLTVWRGVACGSQTTKCGVQLSFALSQSLSLSPSLPSLASLSPALAPSMARSLARSLPHTHARTLPFLAPPLPPSPLPVLPPSLRSLPFSLPPSLLPPSLSSSLRPTLPSPVPTSTSLISYFDDGEGARAGEPGRETSPLIQPCPEL